MDLSDPAQRAVFFEAYDGLPRQGPGQRASTRQALALTGSVDAKPREAATPLRVLDVGCGSGRQTLDLADLLPDAAIVAVDLHEPFLRDLVRAAAAAGVASQVTAVRADMARLPVRPHSIDLLWSEGAAYVMGIPEALAAWRQVLRPGGRAAFTEAVWLRADPPAEARAFWRAEYPAMTDAAGIRAAIGAAGYALVGDFTLPAAAWWDDFYGPLWQRLDDLRQRYRGDEVALGVLDTCRHEIEVFRRYGDSYGYVFFVAQVPPG